MAPRSAPHPPGAHPHQSPTPAATAAPAATPLAGSRPASSPLKAPGSSSLSPDARPFVPSGRSKAQRWKDASPSTDSDGDSPPVRISYQEVLLAGSGPP